MTRTGFPPELIAALDAYTVPPLPQDFAERLLARAESEAASLHPASPHPAPRPKMRENRRPGRSAWARAGRFALFIGPAGFIAATAAAAGIFGEPAYVPVISDILVRAEIIDAPAKTRAQKPLATPAVSSPAADTGPPPVPSGTDSGTDKVKSTLQSLARDPAFQKLPPREKLRQAIKENRILIQSGQATGQDVRRAVAEIRAETPEAVKAERRALIRQKIDERRKRRQAQTPAGPAAPPRDPLRQRGAGESGVTGESGATRNTGESGEAGKALSTDPAAPGLRPADEPVSPPPAPPPPEPQPSEASEAPPQRSPEAAPATREQLRQRIIEGFRKRRGERRR